ncbi:hypothetical protein CBM2604_U20011 [Cupriavidus taiwanensis]|nr:hypothetical protein CBM2604_U20011 [Cupriavidus taiwanensis]
MERNVLNVREDNLACFMKAFEPVFCRLNGVDTSPKAASTRFRMDALILSDQCMNGVAVKSVKKFVVTCIIGADLPRIPYAWRWIT